MFRLLAVGLSMTVAVFALGGAARGAGNTVPQAAAGDGNAAVSGYTVTAITWNPNGSNPQNIDSVTFTATAANGSTAAVLRTIQAKFVTAGGWYTCTRTGGVAPAHNISCTTTAPQLAVVNIDTFTAVIIE